MKSSKFYAGMLSLAVVGGVSALARSGAAEASSGTQASASSNAVTDRYLTSFETELTGKVDTKNGTAGQEVRVRTTQSLRLANGTALPLGTILVGHVTQVEARQKGSGALLGMTFDRAELKSGQTIAVRCVIQAVVPPAKAASDDIMGMAEPVPAAAGASPPGGVRGAGGIFQAPIRPAAETKGAALGTVTADTAGHGAGSPVAAAGESVSPAPKATGLPGVMLLNSGPGNESGTLTASGKNISLESGTRITLGVIAR